MASEVGIASDALAAPPEGGTASGAAMIPVLVSSVDVEGVLLLLKIGFVVLLYLFIWRIVRTASKDLRLPQESFILAPQEAAAAGLRDRRQPQVQMGRLVVLKSPALDENTEFVLDSAGISIGRGAQNDVPLDDDEFASANHARFEPRRDGVWLEDIGSTNGTFVNGVKISRPRKLVPGDLVRVGETDLRFDS
jgi:hypothetical protein